MYITSPTKATFQLVSILISTMTTAFSSALVSYDQDVSVANRKKNPEFYGFVRNTHLKRSVTFVVMMLLSAFHNLSRTIGVALLFAVSGSTTFVFLGAEMAAYIGFKGEAQKSAKLRAKLPYMATSTPFLTQLFLLARFKRASLRSAQCLGMTLCCGCRVSRVLLVT